MAIIVDVDNFVRAETDRMFAGLVARAGAVNRWSHRRSLTSVEQQDVIRMNRDTLYSSAVVDVAEGAMVSIPDAAGRYLSVMVVDQDHYVTSILHDAGEHLLKPDEFVSRHVGLAVRVLVDPSDAEDVEVANRVQDQLGLVASSDEPFVMPDYDEASFDAIRAALLRLGDANGGVGRGAFGRRGHVDPVRHLIGTAIGWGGLPESEAVYLGGSRLPLGRYSMIVRDVPVDAFWSISVYNEDGFFEPNEYGLYNVNSVTSHRDPDGSWTVHFGTGTPDMPNYLPIMEGWNYVVRLYRPRPEVVSGDWTFPVPVPQ